MVWLYWQIKRELERRRDRRAFWGNYWANHKADRWYYHRKRSARWAA